MSIKLIAKCCPKEKNKDKFRKIALELTSCSQNDEGCISYTLNEEIQGDRFMFIEEWENQELLNKHLQKQEHFIKLLENLSVCDSEVIFYKSF
ncbi:hypothetical protein BOP97_02600 [Campylobacter coli]|nr:hypothetical protein BOP97_02600 [Campylobacter coli]HEB9326257.1 antibiotic biosynthesis monooxygenase [Campylobacter coli]